jgi:3D (Asp-Asp-Asp) domain-containing protein
MRVLAVVLLLVGGANAASAKPLKVGRAIVTFYWTVDESSSRYRGKATLALRDPTGGVIAHTTKRFKRDLVKQGTGVLRDGRTLYYSRRIGGEHRFRVTRERYGIGSTGCPLIPHRTIAVDPRFVKLGSKLYIPQVKGARLPDGTVHDGIFVAADRGHFRGAHVDLFVGIGAQGARSFTRRGVRSRSRVTVYADGRASGGCRP